MQVFLTIFSGVLVFVISQIFLKLVIEPVHQFKRIISDISFALLQYANLWPVLQSTREQDEEVIKASDEFSKLGAKLNASCNLIPLYRQTRIIFFLPKKNKINSAIKSLLLLSNLILEIPRDTQNKKKDRRRKLEKNIADTLNIKI